MAPKKNAKKAAKKAAKLKPVKDKAKKKKKGKVKEIDAEVKAAAASAAGKKGKMKKMKNVLKASGDKMKDKLMTKGKLLEKKMKQKAVEMKGKMKDKGNELRKKMRDKLDEAGHDLEQGAKGLKEKLKKAKKGHKSREKLHEEAQADEHTAELDDGGSTRSKLEKWRRPFERHGWAKGKLLHDWATYMLLGLNAFSAFLSLPVFFVTCWLGSKFRTECLVFFLLPALGIGFFFSVGLLFNAVAGFVGVWFNRLGLVKFHYWLTAFVVFLLFSFTVFGFVLTTRGKGTTVEGLELRQYQLEDYTTHLRKLVIVESQWNRIKKCIIQRKLCKAWSYTSAAEFYDAKLTTIQSGCCIPPFACGYAFEGVFWKSPTNLNASEDCIAWSDSEFCLNCKACKAAMLQNVKSRWLNASIVSIVVIFVLLLILIRTWFVMRIAGRWGPIKETVAKTAKAAVGLGDEEDVEEEVLVPSFLEEDGTISEEQASERSEHKKKKKELKKKKGGKKGNSEAGHTEDDAWASPRGQPDPSVGAFPEGFLAQNPLAISRWQTPDPTAVAGYMVDPYSHQDPYAQQQQQQYGQQQYQDPYGYNAAVDPYGQAYQDPNQWQQDPNYYQDPNQGYYQDPNQQAYYQDPYQQQQQQQQQQQGHGYDQYQQQQHQGYMDPNQGYMMDPNQAYQGYGYQNYPQY